MGFETIDEAVKYARLLDEYQVIYKSEGRFYNCRKINLPEGVKILVSVDQLNKEIITYHE